MRSIGKSASHRWEVVLMKHKNMKQYEEKNAPKLNHDITLEEIEAACRAHQKENDNRNMAEECRTIAREQKEKMQAQFTKGRVKASYPASPWPLSVAV